MKKADLPSLLGLLFSAPFALLAVVAGVAARSWATFFSFFLIFVFFAVWNASAIIMRTRMPGAQILGRTVNVICGLAFGACIFIGAEQVYFVNSSSYPAWLANGDLGQVKGENLTDLASHCKHPGANIFVKDDGLVAVRCGGLSMFGTETYLAHMENRK